MKHWLTFLALVVVALALYCSDATRAQEYNQDFAPPTTSSAVLLESDGFEGASEGTNCASAVKVDSKSNTPNCDDTAVVFAGSQALSLQSTDLAGWNLTTTSDGTVEFRGYVFPDVGGAAGTGIAEAIGLTTGATRDATIQIQDHGSTQIEIRLVTADTTGSTTVGIAGDTWYKFCLRYDIDNDDAEGYLDASGGTFCAGAVWSSTADNTSTNVTSIDSCFVKNNGSGISVANFYFDDVEMYDNG